MGKRLTIVSALGAFAGLAVACTASSPDDPSHETTGSTDLPIEGGKPVNDLWNPVTAVFPQSTVALDVTFDGTTYLPACTGIILSTTKVLTACTLRQSMGAGGYHGGAGVLLPGVARRPKQRTKRRQPDRHGNWRDVAARVSRSGFQLQRKRRDALVLG
jgi:hypothetical protein